MRVRPTNDDLVALILPWAKENLPEAYEKTLAAARRPETFRRYLARLIELRCELEPEWKLFCPLRMLEETTLRFKMRHRESGIEIEVAGEKAEGDRTWAFGELAALIEGGASGADLLSINTMKQGLDLELVEWREGEPVLRSRT